jgi:hypothetical protein
LIVSVFTEYPGNTTVTNDEQITVMSEFVFLWRRRSVASVRGLPMTGLILSGAGGERSETAMNPEQIKAEIRKLNWIYKIGIYRWINHEVAGNRGIGTDRSLQIRQEIERIFKGSGIGRRLTIHRERKSIEPVDQSSTQRSQASARRKK